MKKHLLYIILAAASLAFSGCEKQSYSVKIGVFEPASGDNGHGGKQEILGIQYAHQKTPTVEINGKEYAVELEVVDNKSSVEKAPQAAKDLVDRGVSIVIGSYGSAVSLAASDIFESAGIPVIGATCTNPQVTKGNNHYFRICFLDPFQGSVLAAFAVQNFKAGRAYCLAKLGDDYSVGLCNYFMEAFKKLGGEVTFENFPEGTTDFFPYIQNARSQNVDVIFTPVSTEAGAMIIREAASQGIAVPLLSGDTWDSSVILSAAKNTRMQVYVTTFFVEGNDESRIVDFVDELRQYMRQDESAFELNGKNEEIAAVTVMGFDAYYTALEALKTAKSTTSKDLLKSLPLVQYNGIAGAISFDADGNAARDVAYVKQVDNASGTWKFIAVQKTK